MCVPCLQYVSQLDVYCLRGAYLRAAGGSAEVFMSRRAAYTASLAAAAAYGYIAGDPHGLTRIG